MCSKPVVNTIARVTSGVLTLGGSEAARKIAPNSVVSKILNTPGDIVTAGGGGGLVSAATGAATNAVVPKPPDAPPPPAPPPPEESTPGEQPKPGVLVPGSTSVESLQAKRRKKLSALQAGLASTIATTPSGLLGAPSLSNAAAGGLKLKLGA